MKRILIFVICTIAVFYGCKCTSNNAPNAPAPAQAQTQPQTREVTPLTAISNYMNKIGGNYLQGEYCIPYLLIAGNDDSNPEDIKVWGDFWVEKYDQAGDTLKSVSGGSHPGCMHLRKTANGYEVTQFDAVGDGSNFTPTAKAIFGDRYNAFIALQSNDEAKKAARAKSILDYAADNNLKVSYYQDYGWPAVKITQ